MTGRMLQYTVEKLTVDTVADYARIQALTWLQSYQGIIAEDYLKRINRESLF